MTSSFRSFLTSREFSASIAGSTSKFIVLSVIFHLLLVFFVFDIYFVSPVVHVSKTHASPYEGPADRLIFIVGDGLRADTLFQKYPNSDLTLANVVPTIGQHNPKPIEQPHNLTSPAPYLRSIVESGKSCWGLSHTRVPTESRPGHVALIAGMYEDVSAVFTGWKLNPVQFDSVFNRSLHTYAFGSPDIVPMFEYGAVPGRVDGLCYDDSAEDFTSDAIHLDTWVYDQVEDLLLNKAKHNQTLSKQLSQPKTIFFLHLLGLDTTGHAYRPHSMEYKRNLYMVDKIVQETVELFEDFFAEYEEEDDEEMNEPTKGAKNSWFFNFGTTTSSQKEDKTRTTKLKKKPSKNAYIFTSDHGMSNIGNHGDGDADCTRTPLIAWGKGITSQEQEEVQEKNNKHHYKTRTRKEWPQEWDDPQRQKDWFLDDHDKYRKDVVQADIAALMTALVGTEYPGNSVGRIPTEYLDIDSKEKAHALFANAKGILEQFFVKQDQRKSRMIVYKPYEKLLDVEAKIKRIEQMLQNQEWKLAQEYSHELSLLAEHGLTYVHNYDRMLLGSIVVLGYIGSMAFGLIITTIQHDQKTKTKQSSPSSTEIASSSSYQWLSVVMFTLMSSKFFIEQEPLRFQVYAFAICSIWWVVLGEGQGCINALKSISISKQVTLQNKQEEPKDLTAILSGVGVMTSLGLMVLGYTHRLIWTIGLLYIGIVWPMLKTQRDQRLAKTKANNKHKNWTVYLWQVVALCTSLFTMIPVERQENIPVLLIGGLLWVIVSLGLVKECKAKNQVGSKVFIVAILLSLLVCTSVVVAITSARQISSKQGLNPISQMIGWIVVLSSFFSPVLVVRTKPPKGWTRPEWMVVGGSIGVSGAMIMLSMSYEVLFHLCFSILMWLWISLEQNHHNDQVGNSDSNSNSNSNNNKPEMSWTHWRLALWFLFFVHVAFFGTGNVASISSFYLEPVYRIVPVFSPFTMTILLLGKILVPFGVLAAGQGGASRNAGLNKEGGIPLALAASMSDVLGLLFSFGIRDQGSWLEVGQTISHFSIANLLIVLAAAIVGLGGSQES